MQQDNRAAGNGAGRGSPQDEPVAAICARHGNAPGALIEILHDIQHQFGFVPETALPVIAQALNLSRAEVYGVFTFYHDFRKSPPGRHVLKLCMAEACQSMGANKLAAAVARSLGIEMGGTTADGSLTVEPVYCLGNCALAPAAMLDGKLIGRAEEKQLLAAART